VVQASLKTEQRFEEEHMKAIGMILAVTVMAMASGMAGEKNVATLKLTVDGMSCSGCANSITGKFMEQDGVEKVFVHLDSKLVAVGLKKGSEMSDDTAKSVVKDAGYKPEKVERSPMTVEEIREQVETGEE
jgi:copper chaperone CopZ